MGIHKLMSLIMSEAPDAIKQVMISSLNGRTIACDASMAMYSFLISTQGTRPGSGSVFQMKDQDGNLTGHLLGLFYRTIQLMDQGVKPVWVFDGKAPMEKGGQLSKRKEKKQEAEEEKKEALAEGDIEKAVKMAGRSVRITPEMTSDAKTMLRLMGMPVIEAPGEAEAQCSVLAREGKVWATASEDMDSLTFGTPVLLRGFKNVKEPITQIKLDKVLEGFNLQMDEFVDLCILLGCDYMRKISGIGPVKAYDMMLKNGKTLQGVLKQIHILNKNPKRKQIMEIPVPWDYESTRKLFKSPSVKAAKDVELKWELPDEKNLTKFLVDDKGFNQVNVANGIQKLKDAQKKTGQKRLDCFFTSVPKQISSSAVKKVGQVKKVTQKIKKAGQKSKGL